LFVVAALQTCVLAAVCAAGEAPATDASGAGRGFVVMTFNSGTTPGLRHDDGRDDGYGRREAGFSDAWYGNGLAWRPAVEAVARLVRRVDPDLVAFQEMYFPEEGVEIPAEARVGFVAERWSPGDPSVARIVLGDDYQIGYHPGKPNKCLGVHRRFGTIRGYMDDAAVNWLEGAPVKGCGGGARVARAMVDRTNGETLNVICLHGTSGLKAADQDCRVRQVERIFVDFGDGAPGVRGEQNLILGDFNTDPGRAAAIDRSAGRWNDFVGEGKKFHFLSKSGAGAPRAYQGLADIDHIVSDTFRGECQCLGVDQGTERVFDGVYFDHVPVVCEIKE
jgi:endonuclease/exonuclease/phosphatase family metal-dependent hydrolase